MSLCWAMCLHCRDCGACGTWCVRPGWAAGVDRLALLSGLTPVPCPAPVLVIPVGTAASTDSKDDDGKSASPPSVVDVAKLEQFTSKVLASLRRAGVSATCDWASHRKLYMTLRVRPSGC